MEQQHRHLGFGLGSAGGGSGGPTARHSEAAVRAAAKLALDKAIFGDGGVGGGAGRLAGDDFLPLPDWLPLPKENALRHSQHNGRNELDEPPQVPPLTNDYNGNAAVAAAAAAALNPERILAMHRNIQTNSELLRQFQAAAAAGRLPAIFPKEDNDEEKMQQENGNNKETSQEKISCEGVSPPTSPATEGKHLFETFGFDA